MDNKEKTVQIKVNMDFSIPISSVVKHKQVLEDEANSNSLISVS